MIPVTQDGKLLLEKQYKHAVEDFMIEFPAGYLDKNEDPLDAARRELLEETGHYSETISAIATFSHNPTKEIGKVHIFIAENIYKKQETNFDSTEDIELLILSYEQVNDMILHGEIWGTGTVAAALLFFQKIGFLKR